MNKLINYEDQRFKNLFRIEAAKWANLKWTWPMRVIGLRGNEALYPQLWAWAPTQTHNRHHGQAQSSKLPHNPLIWEDIALHQHAWAGLQLKPISVTMGKPKKNSISAHFLITSGLSLTTNGAPLMHESIKKAQHCWSKRTSRILASIFSSSFPGSMWLHLHMAALAWISVLGRWSTRMVRAPMVHPTAPLMWHGQGELSSQPQWWRLILVDRQPTSGNPKKRKSKRGLPVSEQRRK